MNRSLQTPMRGLPKGLVLRECLSKKGTFPPTKACKAFPDRDRGEGQKIKREKWKNWNVINGVDVLQSIWNILIRIIK